MKKLGFIMMGLLMAAGMMATTISGRVVEGNSGAPMPYVTISLMSEDSVLLDGAITDEKGEYRLSNTPAGEYIITASYIGYQTISRAIHTTSNVEDFHLTEETEQLREVEVKAKKPLIERQMDKLVLNVSASPFAIGSNGQDVLKRAPGVRIDQDGNITVNGKSVEVYIDGRPSYMSGEQLKGLLRGTTGASIEKIEIITNPSAKYDASGQGGIINIKLKKNMMQGFNGMLAANYGGMYFKNDNANDNPKGHYYQNEYASLNLNYRSKKTYTSLALTQVYANNGVDFVSYTQQPSGTDTLRLGSKMRYDTRFQYYNLRAGNDWYIDNRNTLGVILNIPIMSYTNKAQSVGSDGTYTRLGEQFLNRTYSENLQSNFSPQHSVNLNFTHVFADSCSQELTANIDYNRYRSHAGNKQLNQDIETLPGFESLPELTITTDQIVNIYSAKLDFQSAFCKRGFVETGIKWALSETDNAMQTDSTTTSTTTTTTTNAFLYSEHVAALYLTASWQFCEQLSVKAGLRGEYTYGIGDWKQEGVENYRNSRFDLFPTAFIGYNPAKDWRLSASYTRRIKRPSYYQLNPFRNYVNAHAYLEGNPELQPEFNNQVDLTIGWSQYISLAGNFAHTQEMMNRKGELLPNGDMRSRWVNFGTCTTHGINLSLTELPIVPKKGEDGKIAGAWLALTLYGGYFNFISRAKTEAGETAFVSRSHFGSFNGTLTAYMPKEYVLSVGFFAATPYKVGYTRNGSGGMMELAFKKTFPKQQLTLSLNVNDLLRSSHFIEEEIGLGEGYISRIDQRMHQQSVSIGLTYMFGQHQWHKYRNVGNTDEAGRLGSGVGGK